VAAPTVVGVSAVNANGIGAVQPLFPSGYTATADDVAITFCECDTADTLTPPSGWAVVTTQNVSTGTAPSKLTAIWRRIVAGDAAPSIADAGNHIVARMMIVRGCETSGNPWDFALPNQELTADTTVSVPGGTTVSADCLILSAFGTGQDITSLAGATGWANASLVSITEQMDDWTASGTGGGFAVATGVKTAAGAVSATTATLSLTANFKTLMMIALKPPAPPASLPELVMARWR
jgi:hypothetical protein